MISKIFKKIKFVKVFSDILFYLFFLTVIILPNYAQALGDVTLTSSAFSDSDAEDTLQASQWVVRDSEATVFDSTNASATITIPAATFTAGTTYYWKVRHQDNHDEWSPYSDESTFVYGTGEASPTPTPSTTTTTTPTPTITATTTPTITATSTGTATATSTATSTGTATPTPTITATSSSSVTSTATSSLGPYQSATATSQPIKCGYDIEIISASYDKETEDVNIIFRAYNSKIALYGNQVLTEKIKDLIFDAYISFGEGSNQNFRLSYDLDYLDDYSWEFREGYGCSYLRIDTNIKMPSSLLPYTEEFKEARAIVHAYTEPQYSWGETVNLKTDWAPYATDPDMADQSDYFLIELLKDEPFILDKDCFMDIISPANNDNWKVGTHEEIIWTTTEYQDDIEKVNISLSKDGGRSVSDLILLTGKNSGFYETEVLERFRTDKAVIQIAGFDSRGEAVSYCKSNTFKISGKLISNVIKTSPIIPTLLLLGSIASILPWLLFSIAVWPGLASFVSRGYLLFAPPAWPKNKPQWGIVYDATTKKPIKGIVLRIFSEPDGRQREIQVSNENGAFGFLVPKGKYSITATGSGYSFPSHIVRSQSDGKYVDIYKGGQIDISNSGEEKAPIQLNIPLDPSEAPVLDVAVAGFIHSVSSFIGKIRIPIMIIGTLASLYLLLEFSRVIDWIVFIAYLILWAIEIRDMSKKKAFGNVQDVRGNPLDLTVIRALDMKGKIVASTVSGEGGRFYLNLDSGRYIFSATKAGYSSTRSNPVEIKNLTDLHRINLTLEKLANTKSEINYKMGISS